MNFATDIVRDLMSRPTPTEALQGLELVEEQVSNVIEAIENELKFFKPKAFETDGQIQGTSFGETDRSSLLALHHRRAHAVTYETLKGVQLDLEAFRSACADARKFVQTADDNAALEGLLTRRAVDRLLEGSASDHGEDANAQAQQEASGSQPTTEPVVDSGSDPSGGPTADHADGTGATQGEEGTA